MTDSDDSGERQGVEAFERDAEDLYENAPCGYLSTLADGCIVRVNRTLLGWIGRTRQELVGRRRFQDLLSTGGRIYYETHYAPLLEMQGAVREIAIDLVAADGRALPVIANSRRVRGGEGQALVRTSLFESHHRREYERELLRARERAESADRAKAEFISTVSHEIRTPLNAIMAVGHLLEEAGLAPAQQNYVRILRSSSQSLLGLINDILDFSRMEAGKLELDERSFDLRQLLEDLTAGERVRAEQKGLELVLEIDPRCPVHLVGDPVKLGQILANLIGNAVKFTERGAVRVEVTATAFEAGAAVLGFRVADTGIGISADRLPHVFESFTQASTEVTAKYGGTGLGLAITRRLVELHGSRLEVESEIGRGSVFSFEVSLRVGGPVLVERAGADASEPLAGRKVLLADDNEVNLVVLGGLLRRWGAHVDLVRGGEEAVERARDGGYEVVLMDLRMPRVDGFEATRRIRSLAGGRELPIIAVSASTRMGDASTLEEAGFTDFVGKPIDPDLLLAKILDRVPAREG